MQKLGKKDLEIYFFLIHGIAGFSLSTFYDIHRHEKYPWGKKYTEKEGKQWRPEMNNKDIFSRDSCPSNLWTIGLTSQLRPSVSNIWKY